MGQEGLTLQEKMQDGLLICVPGRLSDLDVTCPDPAELAFQSPPSGTLCASVLAGIGGLAPWGYLDLNLDELKVSRVKISVSQAHQPHVPEGTLS